eukprot:23595_2
MERAQPIGIEISWVSSPFSVNFRCPIPALAPVSVTLPPSKSSEYTTLYRVCGVWGQEWSSTSKWRRHGNRTDERTCTLLEIIGDLVEVEEIGKYTS